MLRRFDLIIFLLFFSSVMYAQDKKAVLQLDFSENEGKKIITATARELNDDTIGNPIEELDLYFYVERTFSLLPIGDIFNTTDENGRVSIEFPSDLPGDSIGNVNVIARIQESDIYQDTEIKATKAWGIPVKSEEKVVKRSLWAAGANAPISLMLLVNGLIAAAWGLIIYIISVFFKISKM